MASIQKRTTKAGSSSYRVEVRLKGFPPQRATFTRLTDAKKWGQHTETAIREGRYFKTAEARKHTGAELIDRYIRDVLPRPPRKSKRPRGERSQKILKSQLLWWKSELGYYTLADITPTKIAECRDKLLTTPTSSGEPYAPATVNRYMAPLSHAFGVAVREWGWVEDNPMRKVDRTSEPDGRVRFLSEDEHAPDGTVIEGERSRLLKACRESSNPYLFPVITLALSTGMRQGEIMELTWDVVDFQQGRITLFQTKNGEIRVVPLVGKALELLKEHSKIRRLNTTLLFPSKTNPRKPMDLRAPWQAALKTAGIGNFRFHDLRHSAASYLAMNGASLAEIAEILGHRTLQMVQRYAHLSEAHTAGVVERMNRRIFGGV